MYETLAHDITRCNRNQVNADDDDNDDDVKKDRITDILK
jgi:hypothetical protein